MNAGLGCVQYLTVELPIEFYQKSTSCQTPEHELDIPLGASHFEIRICEEVESRCPVWVSFTYIQFTVSLGYAYGSIMFASG